MIAIPPIDCTTAGVLVSTTATDTAAWAAMDYAIDAVVSHAGRDWIALKAQTALSPHAPGDDPLEWFDNGPVNSLAMFDTSVQTSTSVTGAGAVNLTFTIKSGRATAVGLMGLIGQSVTLTVRDGLGGSVIFTDTKTLATSDGSYYSFCFEDFWQQSDIAWTGLDGSSAGHITISITGALSVSCGLCVIGKQFDIGAAQYGFTMPLEDRGKSYLDNLGNPVIVYRGYSKGCSGTVSSPRENFNRLMTFYAANISSPCLWIAAPDQDDLVSATVFGKLSRVVPAIGNYAEVIASIEISGYR